MSNTGAVSFTFRKEERLCRKKIIEQLFREGTHFYIHPFKVIWMRSALPSPTPAQVLLTAGKRASRNATERNHAKRMLRESYRQSKHVLYESLSESNDQIALAIIFTGSKTLTLQFTLKKITEIIHRLIIEMNKSANGLSDIKYPQK